MTYKSMIWCLLALLPFIANSQVRPKASPEDLQLAKELLKTYPKEDVVSLQKTTSFTFALEKNKNGEYVTVRQKEKDEILQIKSAGYVNYSNAIGFDSTSSVSGVKFFARKDRELKTFGATKSASYEENGIFHSDAKIFQVAFPMDGPGCFTAFEFEKKYNEIKYFTSYYFHEYYPAEQVTVSYEIPKWLDIDLILKNGAGYDIKRTESKSKDGNTIITFKASKLKANKQESNAPGASYYLPHIFVHLKSYTDKAGKKHDLFPTTANLYAWYHSLTKAIDNDPSKIRATTESLIRDKKTNEEKIESIFYWVQDNIRYIAFENGIAGFKPDACQRVYSKKFGDCKGMANLLKEMLVIAGFDARLTWLGTRSIAYDYTIPSVAIDNHMICTLMLDGKKYFLDPTEKFISFGDVAHRIQNRQVMIEDGDSFQLATTPEFPKERNKRETTIKFEIKNDKLVGKARESYDGEGKTYILHAYSMIRSDVKEDAIKKLINRDDKNISVSNIKTTDFEDRRGTISFDYDIAVDNQLTDLEKEKYITIDFDQEFKNFTFDSTRTKDYEYDHNYYSVKKIELTIPPGFKVSHLPEAVEKVTPNYSFKLQYKVEGNKVIYSKVLSIDNAIIPTTDFTEWNEAIKKVRKAYGDQLILTKI
ncbi:MAG: transglutaminase domain-containing protein [Bacteroidia bacterium]|nr:transglutaminase domain-containing protein [Bacteroidota bacterium]MBP9081939.1 transglutaminase domain-containing protein [Bacteroidia bacterium]